MRFRGITAGALCGVALGLGALVAMDAATGEAEAQSGFTVTPEQLQINQRISQAAVRRSNQSLNYLAPIRTAQTDAADTGKNGVSNGTGTGWATSQIANQAITTAKIANNAVTSAQIAADAVGTSQIANGAVATADLAPNVQAGVALWAYVDVDANGRSFKAQQGATTLTAVLDGITDVGFVVPVNPSKCAILASAVDEDFYATVDYRADNTARVSTFTSGGVTQESDFTVALYCQP